MFIEDENAARIQELLKRLSTADAFQSVAITREIREIATENSQQKRERMQRRKSRLEGGGQDQAE